jgi:acetoin utilization protein AcuB
MPERRNVIRRDEATWPKPVPVKDWMTRPAVTIRDDASVRAAIEVMKARKIRHLPVVNTQGRLVGIVTDRDLRQMPFDPAVQEQLQEAVARVAERPIREAMTWGVVAVTPESGIRQAARIMYEQKIGAVPVIEGGRVVGMLTERDVLRAFAAMVREGATGVQPLEAASTGEPYEYGFTEQLSDEPGAAGGSER